MLNSKYTRTTITIPEEILWAIKEKALAERKAFWEVVTEGLTLYLKWPKSSFAKNPEISSLFGSWGKGLSGKAFIKKIRSSKADKLREKYLSQLWKKS